MCIILDGAAFGVACGVLRYVKAMGDGTLGVGLEKTGYASVDLAATIRHLAEEAPKPHASSAEPLVTMYAMFTNRYPPDRCHRIMFYG